MASKNGLFDYQENWENLANAIIVKAADDYRYTVKREQNLLKKLNSISPASKKATTIRADLETVRWDRNKIALFFNNSPWFSMLGISGEYLLTLLEAEEREILGEMDAV